MADFTEVQWAPPNSTSNSNEGEIHEHALMSLQSAASAAQEFNDRFRVRDSERESSVPLFMGDELVLGREPIRKCGYYAEYELKSVRVLMDLVGDGGNFAAAVEVKRQSVFDKSAQGALSVKYLQAGLLESDHGPGAAADMITEIRILMNMAPHENVAEIYGINQGGIDTLLEKGRKGFFMITDCMTETLSDRMCSWREKLGYDPNSTMTRFNQRMQAALQVASALVHLHDNEIVYHLRPDKVGYDKQDGQLKLYNFSQARQDGTKDHSRSITSSDDIRTLAYTAPEVLCMAPATTSADVYSFGILLWETMSLRHPYDRFDRATHFEQAVQQHKRPPINRQWPEHLRQLLEACWHPHMRMNMNKVHQTLESTLLLSAQLCAQQASVTAQCAPNKTMRNPNRSAGPSGGSPSGCQILNNSAHRTVPPSPGGRGRKNIGLSTSMHSESCQSQNTHRIVPPPSPGGRGRNNGLNISSHTDPRGGGGPRSRSRSRSRSREVSGRQHHQQSIKPIPNLLGNSSHHSGDDQEFAVEFDKKSQATATTVEDGHSSNGSSGGLSSPQQSDQRRGMMTRAGSLRNVHRGNNQGQPKTPTKTGPSRRGMLQKNGASSMRNVVAQPKTPKMPKTPGQPVRRGLLQKVGGSMRNITAVHDDDMEQAKTPTTPSRLRLLKNTTGSMRNVFKGRSQPGGTEAQEMRNNNTPATPGGGRPLKNFDKNGPGSSWNITAEPKTPPSGRGMLSKQLSSRKQNSSHPGEITEPKTPQRRMFQKIASLRNALGNSKDSNDILGANSSGNFSFDPTSVELSPKPEPKQKLTTKSTGQTPSTSPKGGGKAPLTIMCPSPTPKRLGFGSGSVNGSGSVCGSVVGSVQDEENRVAAIAARKQVKQQLAAIQQSLAPIQSPFRTARKLEIPLLYPPTPEQSVAKTIKSTSSIQDKCVFENLLESKNHDSFGFDDSGWNMNVDDYSDEEDTNPSPLAVTVGSERKPGGVDSLTILGTLSSITFGKDMDQPSAISCLTGDGSPTEGPVTPSRQVTLRKSTSARSVIAPPPLDIEGC